MRANALRDWFEGQGNEVLISHPLETTFQPYAFGSNFYNFIQKKLPAFHNIYFYFLEFANLHRNPTFIFGAKKWLLEISDFAPDIVFSVHAHLNHGYYLLLKQQLGSSFKFMTYCGEMSDSSGFSRHWVNPNIDSFLGPFKETCEAAIKRGMPDSKVHEVGPLLRKAFYKKQNQSDRKKILEKLSISPDLPLYLLGTGANGANQHIPVLNALNNGDSKFQVVALCGNNNKVFNEINNLKGLLNFKVFPLPTIDDVEMVSLLKSAEFLFARPGAGTTTEAVVCGTPMLFDISGGIMPQERNNLNFWSGRSKNLIKLSSPKRLPVYLGHRIPKINVEIDEAPVKLFNHLEAAVCKS